MVLSVIGFIAVLISIGLAIVAAILAMNSNNQKEKERGTALLAALLFLLPLLGMDAVEIKTKLCYQIDSIR